ncbi:curli-like amyloid fiber formation chaperone CsgH [Devosia sp. Root635]|uniref:curli-like amyloid fiber formation chaperone CsgH n=1 Tax=Devosia sp. Root635 TaxID=1736575 RepID=UPI0006F226B6|nr:curli-like amyloid fiber formation chaperone CsgH [Devosia sp. Root635]KRA45564.1 hypothetical protein ASD80_04315 [Devosia sp. Root635]
MTIPSRRIGAIALGLAVAALAANAGLANSASSDTLCGIATNSERGMLVLEGIIVSPAALSGEYRFAVQSSGNGGSTNISQGGHFAANANEDTILGKVLVNAGSSYDIAFDVTVGGQKIDCDQDIASLR